MTISISAKVTRRMHCINLSPLSDEAAALKDGLVRQGVIYGDRHEKKGGTYVGI
jgi:hypothetical protein